VCVDRIVFPHARMFGHIAHRPKGMCIDIPPNMICWSLSDECGSLFDECGSLFDECGSLVDECGSISDECGSLFDEMWVSFR